MKYINIDGQVIGDGYPVFFMAEIGGNYATFEEAKALIDAAKQVDINAIKFQTFEAETITTKNNFFDMDATGRVSQYELFKELEPNKDVQRAITQYSHDAGMTIFSAPSHIKDLELMEELDLPAYKIGSDLACHLPLLKEVGKTGKPIILSTGMCTLIEVREAVETILSTGNEQIAILHCVSDYPTKIEEVNLKAITTLKREFLLPVGYSDHTIGIDMTFASIAIGANLIEKHFTLDKTAAGPDNILSLLPDEYCSLIEKTRRLESAMGTGVKQPSVSERKHLKTNRVSIIALQELRAGQVINEDMVDIRRPGSGLAPRHWEKVIGKKVNRTVNAEEPLQEEYIEDW